MEDSKAVENLLNVSAELYRCMLRSRNGKVSITMQLARQIDYILSGVVMVIKDDWEKKKEAIQ